MVKSLIKKKSVKETLWALLTKGSTFIWFILLNILLARGLGVEKFGTWSFLFAIMTILSTVGILGFSPSVRSYVAKYNNTKNLPPLIWRTYFIRLILSLLFCILLFFIFPYLWKVISKPNLITFSTPLILFVFFNTLNEYGKHIFTGLHKVKFGFLINTSEFLSKTILIGSAVFYGVITVKFALYSFILGALLGGITTTILLVYFVKHYTPTEKSLSSTPSIYSIIRYALPLLFISIGFMLLTEIDTIMLGILRNESEVGIYGIAKQISIKLPQISFAISMGSLPVFAKLNQENKSYLKRQLFTIFKVNNLIFIPLVLSGLILSPWIIPIIFGADYEGAVTPLQILLLYTFAYANTVLLSGVLNYVGKANQRARNLSITVVINILLNLWLIPHLGAEGAALATLLSYLPFSILNWWEVKKTFK